MSHTSHIDNKKTPIEKNRKKVTITRHQTVIKCCTLCRLCKLDQSRVKFTKSATPSISLTYVGNNCLFSFIFPGAILVQYKSRLSLQVQNMQFHSPTIMIKNNIKHQNISNTGVQSKSQVAEVFWYFNAALGYLKVWVAFGRIGKKNPYT